MKSLKLLMLTSVAALAFGTGAAQAQSKTFYVAGYGGSFEQTMRQEIIPAFEAKHGVKVEYVAGNSTDTLAKLQAQKGNQQIDVAIVDEIEAMIEVASRCERHCGQEDPRSQSPVIRQRHPSTRRRLCRVALGSTLVNT